VVSREESALLSATMIARAIIRAEAVMAVFSAASAPSPGKTRDRSGVSARQRAHQRGRQGDEAGEGEHRAQAGGAGRNAAARPLRRRAQAPGGRAVGANMSNDRGANNASNNDLWSA
jgi:hypothetical protein